MRDGRSLAGVEADVCAACGERYYDLEAMQRLEAKSGRLTME